MRTLLRIMKTELRVLFYSPIAWLILIVFAFQAGMEFSDQIAEQLRSQSLGYSPFSASLSMLGRHGGVYSMVLENLYLYTPLLTMGLMSRELSSGSIKLLYSSPVSNIQIILGKYFSTIIFGLILVAILLLPMIFLGVVVKDFDWAACLVALLGLFLAYCCYAAIGLFMSTVTHYQVVAVIGTLGILAILNFVGSIGQEIDFVREITYWLSISGRSDVFMEGLMCSQDILYFLLVIFLFIALSVIKLQGERTKQTKLTSGVKYSSVVLIVLFVGYLSTIPKLIVYYDGTATKRNTLTQASQDIVKKLEGGLTITTYVNRLEDNYYKGSPGRRLYESDKFNQYVRFKPETKLKYVYYYDKAYNPRLDGLFPGLSDRERMIKICEIEDADTSMFLSPAQLKEKVDLSGEGNRFVRVIERENGKKAFLRIFEDQSRDPSETEITVALKTLVDKSPMVGFLAGHGERGYNDIGEIGYGAFAQERTFRYSLINQGFQVSEITLAEKVAANIDIMVIADMKSALTEQEQVNLDEFIARGGNLIIAGEPKRREFMNPIVEKLGVRFMEGVLVQPTKEYLADVIPSNILESALECSQGYAYSVKKNYKIITPSVCGLEYSKEKGFNVVEVLATNPQGVWNEMETTNFIDEQPVLNPAAGEVEKAYVTMLYLTRDVNGKQQRIMVLGDADCMANSELTKTRAGIDASNFTLITESFRAMSYEEYPITTDRVRPPDDKIYLPQSAGLWIKLFFMWLLPISLVVCTILLLLRRKRR